VAIQNRTDFDSRLLAVVGRRAADLGQGMLPSTAAAMLSLSGRLDVADAALQSLERAPDSADAQWERIERQWVEVVDVYEQTHADHSLQAFANWFQLAVHAGVEHDDADRVTMMTVHAAKGREWPIVIMLGSEDDQYVFPIDPDVEDARRHFYVGMTRARDLLIITHATHVNGRPRSGSRFLTELGLPARTAAVGATRGS
jgi:superfamily I DNA/RNA helicase